jgi:gluconokinase
MIIVVIGVSGSGKTTIDTMLADGIRCRFLEGDSLHPRVNVEKMRQGIPLTDSDRVTRLAAIRTHILKFFKRGGTLVVVCSALKQQFRKFLAEGTPIIWVYLNGSAQLIRSCMKHRSSHFMKADMLSSQFDALEEPSDAIVVDVSPPPSVIVSEILAQLRKPQPTLQGPAVSRCRFCTEHRSGFALKRSLDSRWSSTSAQSSSSRITKPSARAKAGGGKITSISVRKPGSDA